MWFETSQTKMEKGERVQRFKVLFKHLCMCKFLFWFGKELSLTGEEIDHFLFDSVLMSCEGNLEIIREIKQNSLFNVDEISRNLIQPLQEHISS